ncbi:MAG: DUF503 domain-containing protein [Phycisphaeraceae bacterium]
MIIGVLQVELMIHQAQSLKDKRRVVMSIKDRLHHDHQVSVAEVDAMDNPNRAVLGVVLASNDARHTQSVLDRILDQFRVHPACVLGAFHSEMISGR